MIACRLPVDVGGDVAQAALVLILFGQTDDETALVELWTRAHTAYGGHVRRSVDYWRWCVLARPGVEPADILMATRDDGVPVGYGVLAGGGVVIEFAIDPSLIGEAREVVAEQLRTTNRLCFEDFFPDRQVDIEKRPFMQPSQLPLPPKSPMLATAEEKQR